MHGDGRPSRRFALAGRLQEFASGGELNNACGGEAPTLRCFALMLAWRLQEFASGGDLFEDLKRNGGTIKEKYVVRDIIVPFLNALQYLHGLVRRRGREGATEEAP